MNKRSDYTFLPVGRCIGKKDKGHYRKERAGQSQQSHVIRQVEVMVGPYR